MSVRRILKSKNSPEVFSIAPGEPVTTATSLLSEKRVGAVMISQDGQHIDGILSERDIVRELGRRGTACLDDPVSALMTKDVITASLDDTAVQVLNTMTNGRFRHLPVVEDGAMVGVISIGDVVKYRIDEVERENNALTDMIAGNA